MNLRFFTTFLATELGVIYSRRQNHIYIYIYIYIYIERERLTVLTHWGRVTHICVSKLTIIGSDNGLPSDRRQAIIWTNDGILLFRTLGIKFSSILIEIQIFLFKKVQLKISSGEWRILTRPECVNDPLCGIHRWHPPITGGIPAQRISSFVCFSVGGRDKLSNKQSRDRWSEN